ncbi:hypothetical protein [Nocardia abscessus]|uniref:hypothetical protein n=1 Tax=Nocardia abscessus TaxID=120957 RepID=UPI002454EDD5|nr:hypothetical protein [Nocardia abscessus]
MRKRIPRIAALAATAVATSALAIVTAGPAQADTADCTWYLGHMGYSVGDKATDACTKAAANYGGDGWAYCDDDLRALGVHPNHSAEACWRGLKW